MRLKDLRVGHAPSLLGALIHFEVSFGVWVLLGVLGPFIAEDFSLSPGMKGLVVATPLLAGAAFRIVVGWLADAFGPRRIGTMTMGLAVVPLAWGWLAGNSVGQLFGIGLLLGIAGASFAVALPLAGSHYPPSHQGLAMGIAGAGNSGTILAALFAPRIAGHVGWHATLGLAIAPVVMAAIAFRLLAREAPGARIKRTPREAFAPLRQPDCWRVCGLYAVTFGGYVGFASYLPFFLIDKYSVSRVAAGTMAAVAAGAGSLLRPVGGVLSDRFGGARVLGSVFSAVALCAIALSGAPNMLSGWLMFIVMFAVLGIGNGAVTQLVPARFPDRIGVVMGLMGAAGGVGGFLLPSILGALRGLSGSYSTPLWLYAAAALIAWASVVSIRMSWKDAPVGLTQTEGG